MSETRDLLIEIGTEELPPKALPKLRDAFAQGVEKGLNVAALSFGELKAYAAPRRLALLIKALPVAQQDREEQRRGPALQAAFDDEGCPTKAAEGFAKSCGTTVDKLERLETDKGAWLAFTVKQAGQSTAQLIPDIVQQSLNQLPIPKRMRWGSSDVEFVRPVHWVVMLFGDEVIEADILGVQAGRETRGHRFHHPDPLYIGEPAAYAPMLETEGFVVADFAERREAIRGQVMEAARKLHGQAVLDEDLLDEVTALVEWPVAVSGSFEERFLEVPAEALISSMQDHQKYFPVVDADKKLLPHFITIANIVSKDVAQVRAGNERVIRPRLSDAAFFWNQDRKQPLAERLTKLGDMVFQKKLGTLLDKQTRVTRLAAHIAGQLNGNAAWAERAATLAKCDLLTSMVFEFPELQGIMGRYYAAHDGEPAEVAEALDEQYMPRFAGDQLPDTVTGQALAMADRLDTIVGIFAIGQPPTGDKDPFALRRAALGVLRILIEKAQDLDLQALLEFAAAQFETSVKATAAVNDVFEFMLDRLKAYSMDAGFSANQFEAVRERRPTRPLDFVQRLKAVKEFEQLPQAESLSAANKRIGNILRKAEETIPDSYNPAHLVEPQEQALADKLSSLETSVRGQIDAGQYTEALKTLAELRETVDAFFDDVMVMAEDAQVRINRLALLKQLQSLFMQIADLSRLQG